jgi:hypothetical protein
LTTTANLLYKGTPVFADDAPARLPLLVSLGEVDDGSLRHVECGTKFVGEGTITRPGGGYDND